MKKFWKLDTYFKGYYLNYGSIFIEATLDILAIIGVIFIAPFIISQFIAGIAQFILIELNYWNEVYNTVFDLSYLNYIINVQMNFMIYYFFIFFNLSNPLFWISGFLIIQAYILSIKKRDDKNSK